MKDYTVEEVKEKLKTDRAWIEKAIKVLYAHQTENEKTSEMTHVDNKVGFNAVDAPFLSSLAKFLQRVPHLTDRQIYYAGRKLPKYARQLLELGRTNV